MKLKSITESQTNNNIPVGWSLNDDGTYDVDHPIRGKEIKSFVKNGKLTINFNKIKGFFDCSYLGLISLDGCPKEIKGGFYCNNNKLTSLQGMPQIGVDAIDCSENRLINLVGIPKKIRGSLDCACNRLTSLDGCPEDIKGDFDVCANNLMSLDGCPKHVTGWFGCANNPGNFIEEDVLDVCKVRRNHILSSEYEQPTEE